eukprot:3495095-Rhodomonas_salina.1
MRSPWIAEQRLTNHALLEWSLARCLRACHVDDGDGAGGQEKHDHLIDIDLAGEWLFEPPAQGAADAGQGRFAQRGVAGMMLGGC